jgi:acid phosphatase (class A)
MIFARFSSAALQSFIALLAVLAGLVAPVAGRAQAAFSAGESVVLNPDPLSRVVGLPPAPESAAAREDLAILLWLQSARTPEMEASAWLLLERNLGSFSRALGVDMAKSTPQINAALKRFLIPVDAVMGNLKNRYQRPRPFIAESQIQPCLPREQGYSFPSGHSTWYRAASELLADLLPERRTRLVAVGSHGGNSRVLCGVHYPSDVQAGQRLGVAAAAQLIASPQWQAFKADPAVIAEVEVIRQVPERALPQLVR